jgi:hypothetical protein
MSGLPNIELYVEGRKANPFSAGPFAKEIDPLWLNLAEISFSIVRGKSLHNTFQLSSTSFASASTSVPRSTMTNTKPLVWTKTEFHQGRIKGPRIDRL